MYYYYYCYCYHHHTNILDNTSGYFLTIRLQILSCAKCTLGSCTIFRPYVFIKDYKNNGTSSKHTKRHWAGRDSLCYEVKQVMLVVTYWGFFFHCLFHISVAHQIASFVIHFRLYFFLFFFKLHYTPRTTASSI